MRSYLALNECLEMLWAEKEAPGVSSGDGGGEASQGEELGGRRRRGAAERFNSPTGLARDKDGSILVADAGNSTVRRVMMAGEVSTVAGNGKAGMPTGRKLDFKNKDILHRPIGENADSEEEKLAQALRRPYKFYSKQKAMNDVDGGGGGGEEEVGDDVFELDLFSLGSRTLERAGR